MKIFLRLQYGHGFKSNKKYYNRKYLYLKNTSGTLKIRKYIYWIVELIN